MPVQGRDAYHDPTIPSEANVIHHLTFLLTIAIDLLPPGLKRPGLLNSPLGVAIFAPNVHI
jgi:hypothetical protein